MTLRHMQIFIAVSQWGGMTRAAEQLHIAQPSISVAIRELEQHYGVALFDRIGRKLLLTDAGRSMLARARQICALFDEMESLSRSWEEAGRLRVGSSITIGTERLARVAARMREFYPRLRLEVDIHNSSVIERRILENDLDLGLIEVSARRSELLDEVFGEDELVFLCAPDHPFAGSRQPVERLKAQPFLFREQGSAGRALVDAALRAQGLEVEPLWQSIDTQSLVSAVRANLGVAVLPRLLVQDAIDLGRIRTFQVEGVSLTRSFHLIRHRDKHLTRPMQAFIDLLHEQNPPSTPETTSGASSRIPAVERPDIEPISR